MILFIWSVFQTLVDGKSLTLALCLSLSLPSITPVPDEQDLLWDSQSLPILFAPLLSPPTHKARFLNSHVHSPLLHHEATMLVGMFNMVSTSKSKALCHDFPYFY